MEGIFSKCGSRCDRCPAYRENVRGAEDRLRCSDGWHKYLGARVRPERCYCDGCQTPDDENPILIYGKGGCSIRKCAVKNGVLTCAHCGAYPCEAVRTQFSFDDGSREEIDARLGSPMPEEDYLTFIEPYELHRHLEEIRTSLRPEDIVEPAKPPPFRPRTVDFPDDLPLSEEESSAFAAVQRLLTAANTVDADTYVMLERAKKRRQHLLKLLWAFGRCGERREDGGPHLVLDCDVYYQQKLPGQHTRVIEVIKALEEHGVHCELVPLGEGWMLPSGWLKGRTKRWKAGWLITMAFDEQAGGKAALEALQAYAAGLDEKHGKTAYRRFARADMRGLSQG
jgi:hypothetical protein